MYPKEIKKHIDYIKSCSLERLESDGLCDGKLGLIYYYSCLYKATPIDVYFDNINVLLNEVLDDVNNGSSNLLNNCSLYDGLSGLIFVIDHLIKEEIIEDNYLNYINNLKEILVDNCLLLIKNKNYDYFNGSIGILYVLAILKDKKRINEVINVLYEISNKDFNYLFYNRSNYIEGIHFGYAHGIIAIIKVLTFIKHKTLKKEKLLNKLLCFLDSWVCTQGYEINDTYYYLPRSLHYQDEVLTPNWRSVLAWSNSDLNYSTLVYSLPERFKTEDRIVKANHIAKMSINRQRYEQTRVSDYRFYFGSSGNIMSYLFLYEKTNNHIFLTASEFWYKTTLSYLSQEDAYNMVNESPINFINSLPCTILSLLYFNRLVDSSWRNLFLI